MQVTPWLSGYSCGGMWMTVWLLLLPIPGLAAPPMPEDATAREETLTKTQYGKNWPFLVKAGVLQCRNSEDVVFQTDGKVYAINGAAMEHGRQQGYRNADEIKKPHPQLSKSCKYAKFHLTDTNILEKGAKLCQGASVTAGSAPTNPNP